MKFLELVERMVKPVTKETLIPIARRNGFEVLPGSVENFLSIGASNVSDKDSVDRFDEWIKTKLHRYGWHTEREYKRRGKMTRVDVVPNYPEVAGDSSLYKDNDRYLWHMTSVKNLKKIMKKGLIPKRGLSVENGGKWDRQHPPRVYLATRKWYTLKTIKLFFSTLRPKVVLRIDLQRLRKERNINFYSDDWVTNQESVWTPTHIPSKYIEVDTLILNNAEIPWKLVTKEQKQEAGL